MDEAELILPDGLSKALIYYGDPGDWKYDDDFDEAALDEFLAEFEPLGNQFLANPDESWYQGVSFAAVIVRKSDGQKFGYPYWEVISKHGEAYAEPNGDEFGLDYDKYVWRPVQPFSITGYQIAKES